MGDATSRRRRNASDTTIALNEDGAESFAEQNNHSRRKRFLQKPVTSRSRKTVRSVFTAIKDYVRPSSTQQPSSMQHTPQATATITPRDECLHPDCLLSEARRLPDGGASQSCSVLGLFNKSKSALDAAELASRLERLQVSSLSEQVYPRRSDSFSITRNKGEEVSHVSGDGKRSQG